VLDILDVLSLSFIFSFLLFFIFYIGLSPCLLYYKYITLCVVLHEREINLKKLIFTIFNSIQKTVAVVCFLVYVDDIIINGSSAELIQDIRSKLHATLPWKQPRQLT